MCSSDLKMCRASSINTNVIKIAGLALSNALVGLSGALVGQYQGFADVSSGTGMIMVGLASVIIGEVFVKNMSVTKGLFLSVIGSVVYRMVIQAALEVDLIDASALKLITAIIVGGFMAIPAIKTGLSDKRQRKNKDCRQDKTEGVSGGLLDVQGLEKTFNPGLPMENKVLKDFSLVLEPGDFACVVGSNGAGKSTFFNTIAGSVSPDRGSIRICGRDVTDLPDYKRARKLSRVFQDPTQGTAPNLTVAENIALAYGRACGSSLKFAMRKSRYDFIYEQLKELGFGLEDRMDTCVGLLSGGQRQAISLLMATIGDPELLLLDEHTAALDPEATERIMELTEKIVQEKNITCLMITHDLHSALVQGNKCLVMDEGRIVAQIHQDQRMHMDVDDLLDLYKKNTGRVLADDKILFAD